MKKKTTEPYHIVLALVGLVAIVGIVAIITALTIPRGWQNAAWATTGHPQLQYPGEPSGKWSEPSSDLLPSGAKCSSDVQCESGSCNLVYGSGEGTSKPNPGKSACA